MKHEYKFYQEVNSTFPSYWPSSIASMTSGAILVKEEREEQITYSVCGCTSSHSPTQPPHTHTPPSHTHRQEAMDHYTTHCRNTDIYITHMQILTHSLTKMVYPQMSWLVMKMPQTQSQLQEREKNNANSHHQTNSHFITSHTTSSLPTLAHLVLPFLCQWEGCCQPSHLCVFCCCHGDRTNPAANDESTTSLEEQVDNRETLVSTFTPLFMKRYIHTHITEAEHAYVSRFSIHMYLKCSFTYCSNFILC